MDKDGSRKDKCFYPGLTFSKKMVNETLTDVEIAWRLN
jgi:hypothetical protein